MPAVTIHSEAVFSPCRKFRYWLSKEWGRHGKFGVFLCYNPSTANEVYLDPTTLACNNLAYNWGWRGFGIINLFPQVGSSRPPSLSSDPANDCWIIRAKELADKFVVATGAEELEATRETIRRVKITFPFYAIKKAEGGLWHPLAPGALECPYPIILEPGYLDPES